MSNWSGVALVVTALALSLRHVWRVGRSTDPWVDLARRDRKRTR